MVANACNAQPYPSRVLTIGNTIFATPKETRRKTLHSALAITKHTKISHDDHKKYNLPVGFIHGEDCLSALVVARSTEDPVHCHNSRQVANKAEMVTITLLPPVEGMHTVTLFAKQG
jgi:hypothetical protein